MTVDFQSGAGELYELENDPAELTNLFDDPSHEMTWEALTTMLESRTT